MSNAPLLLVSGGTNAGVHVVGVSDEKTSSYKRIKHLNINRFPSSQAYHIPQNHTSYRAVAPCGILPA